MALADIDRKLLQRCLTRKPRAWEDFVDRFMGLVVHVVNHSAQARSIRLTPADLDDLVAEVFFEVIDHDFAVLRHFRGESSLATYLTVIARRIVVRELLKSRQAALLEGDGFAVDPMEGDGFVQRIMDRDEVDSLLRELNGPDAEIVRMYHLEGRSYQEISAATKLPENSIGPTLHRARAKLRRAGSASV